MKASTVRHRAVLVLVVFASTQAACGGQAASHGNDSGASTVGSSAGSSAGGVSGVSGASSGSSSAGMASGSTSSGSASTGTSASGLVSAGSSSGTSQTGSASGAGGASGSGTTLGSGSQDGGSSGADGGRPPDTCTSSANCPGGACWLHLDGHKACVQPVATPQLDTCFDGGPFPCCSNDAACKQAGKTNARCLPDIDVAVDFCGGAVPFSNVCRYDECSVDSDCVAQKPAGATVATCLPAGALVDAFNSNRDSRYNATCAYGVCRTDADCTLHPGGQCTFGLAATGGKCSLVDVLFCAYPSDPCQGNGFSQTACGGAGYCVPNANNQGRQCGQGPPAYP